jgi:hypothetical protein
MVVRISRIDVGIPVYEIPPRDAADGTAGSFQTRAVTWNERYAGEISIMEFVDHQRLEALNRHQSGISDTLTRFRLTIGNGIHVIDPARPAMHITVEISTYRSRGVRTGIIDLRDGKCKPGIDDERQNQQGSWSKSLTDRPGQRGDGSKKH